MNPSQEPLRLGLNPEEWEQVKTIADIHSANAPAGGVIYLICPKTTMSPEELAMLQSLYSRKPTSILHHLIEVAQKGAKKFMKQFFVEYGHKSIGDCGNILVAFEGVSILAVKAIQDSQLYAGQEASTRYIDFSHQPFLSPNPDVNGEPLLVSTEFFFGQTLAQHIQETWREFYMENLPKVFEWLKEQNPYGLFESPDTTRAVWEKAMNTRAFDIMRGFLPAGATTFVAWWTSISHAGDHLAQLRCHAMPEVVAIAIATQNLLRSAYPDSFSRVPHQDREDYKQSWYKDGYFFEFPAEGFVPQVRLALADPDVYGGYRSVIMGRPKGVEIPWQIGEAVNVSWLDRIDYGSFRDIQRHRAVIQRMPLLTMDHGVHPWYLENLPNDIRQQAEGLIIQQFASIGKLGLNKFDQQYLLPLCMRVPIRITGSLSKITYLLELRAQKVVHPTLHEIAYNASQVLKGKLARVFDCDPERIPLYVDSEVGQLTLKRGKQDIIRLGDPDKVE